MDVREVKRILAEESGLFLEFGQLERELQDAIIARDWAAMDAVVAGLDVIGRRIVTVEQRRSEVVAEVRRAAGLPADATFGELASRVPEQERAELGRLHRSLQISVLRVRSITGGIDSYVRSSLRSADTVLGEVFPDQKGTIYSRRGGASRPDRRAMVLDRRL